MRIVSLAILFIAIALNGCARDTVYAPVTDAATIEQVPQNGVYKVMPGDTLYSISWRYGLDYRYLAKRNNILPPYHIQYGQMIYLNGQVISPRATVQFSPRIKQPVISTPVENEPVGPIRFWRWPTKGRVIGTYSSINKGINISGSYGASVVAAAKGKVVYSGNGLRMYGELIIIKHNNLFLSAYAYNSKILVKEGDWVRAGQKIAEMGYAARRRPMLHFEIRRGGRPVNPLSYLGKK